MLLFRHHRLAVHRKKSPATKMIWGPVLSRYFSQCLQRQRLNRLEP